MTFKKDGTDPVFDPTPNKQTLGFRWIGAAARMFGFLVPKPEREYDPYQHYRGKRAQQKRAKGPNMKLVSKRVRRKHRRACA